MNIYIYLYIYRHTKNTSNYYYYLILENYAFSCSKEKKFFLKKKKFLLNKIIRKREKKGSSKNAAAERALGESNLPSVQQQLPGKKKNCACFTAKKAAGIPNSGSTQNLFSLPGDNNEKKNDNGPDEDMTPIDRHICNKCVRISLSELLLLYHTSLPGETGTSKKAFIRFSDSI